MSNMNQMFDFIDTLLRFGLFCFVTLVAAFVVIIAALTPFWSPYFLFTFVISTLVFLYLNRIAGFK